MNEKNEVERIKCGIIMPISALDGCSNEHWAEVKSIFEESVTSIEKYNFVVSMVSEADDIGIIQKRIVQNVYNSDIVICDVSGKNPNVMFELGMRLAFDKPTIIVKDEQTSYTFDTGIIEHIEYPRDLRFTKIVEFKKKLNNKLVATLEESRKNPDHSTFLKSFGQFKVVTLNEQEVTPDRAILDSIDELRREIYSLRRPPKRIVKVFPEEALIKARTFMEEYSKDLSITSFDKLANNKDLYELMIEKVDARRYFPTEDDYKEFFNYVIKTHAYDPFN